MLVLLLVPPWLALILAAGRLPHLQAERKAGKADWRDALLLGTVFFGVLVVLATEGLGVFHALHPGTIGCFWGVVAALAAGWIWTCRRDYWNSVGRGAGLLGADLWILAGICALLAAAAFVTAVASPPTHPDVLGYHLPRQMMWLQQGSLDFYSTPDQKQLRMPPFAEMVGLHLLALGCGDSYANLPEFLCYLLTMVAVSILVRELGGGARPQLLAVFLWATVPMAYQEASSGKNDLMTALWVSLLALQVLRTRLGTALSSWEWAILGSTLGLCWLTKGTGLIYSLPILALLGWSALRRRRGVTWAGLALALGVAVLLGGNHYRRNLAWYGSPLGRADSLDRDEMNHRFTAGAWISNLLRDAALELPTPSSRVNEAMEGGLAWGHRLIGEDIDDPRTSLVPTGGHFGIRYQPDFDSLSAAPVQALLALALPFWLLGLRQRDTRLAWTLVGFAALGFAFFAAAAKWQPWGARLQLPLFALAIPGVAWAACKDGRLTGNGILAAVAAVLALVPALNIFQRPLWGQPNLFTAPREEIEFRFWPELRAPEQAVAAELADKRVHCVRFAMDQMNWAYPMMRMLVTGRHPAPLFWGTRGSPPPDAVVEFLGADRLPMEINEPGVDEPLFAMGDTAPFLVYVRRSLVAEGAVRSQIPRFIGWSDSQGLARVSIGTPQGRRDAWLASGDTIRLGGPFTGSAPHLRADLRVLKHPTGFVVQVAGRILAEVRVSQNETRTLDIAAPGAGEIFLRPAGQPWDEGNLIFLRLQVIDPATLPSQALGSTPMANG